MPSNVRLLSDPVLRIPCKDLTVDNGLDSLDSLLEEMRETMVAENGVGLAANQIGRSVRVFILKHEDSYREFVNPSIVEQEELVDFEGEGCLSIPGAEATTKRFKRIKLRWTDRAGTIKEDEFFEMQTFAVQHEMDHLNGKLYIDQFGPLKRDMVVKKHKKFLKFRSK